MSGTTTVPGKGGSFKIHKGALHRALGVPEGEKIPASKMASARNSNNPHVRHMASSAVGLEHMGHAKKRQPTSNRSNFGGKVFD